MTKKWTVESAKSYVTRVQKGKQQAGLTYCSALAFLENHASPNVGKQSKENNNGNSETTG